MRHQLKMGNLWSLVFGRIGNWWKPVAVQPPSKPVVVDFDKETRRLLNQWCVDTYANNPHLYSIPQRRKDEKYKEIRKSLGG